MGKGLGDATGEPHSVKRAPSHAPGSGSVVFTEQPSFGKGERIAALIMGVFVPHCASPGPSTSKHTKLMVDVDGTPLQSDPSKNFIPTMALPPGQLALL